MTTTSNIQSRSDEAQLRQLIAAQRGPIGVRDLDRLMDLYSADALISRRRERSPQKREAPRCRCT